MRVLFVCLGNICRSPAAEGALRALRPDWQVASAGIGDWHVGKPPHPDMVEACAAAGLDISRQRARRVAPADLGRYDMVLAMERDVLAALRAMPGGDRARLFAEAAGLGAIDVPDPYYSGDHSGTLEMIRRGVVALGADNRVGERR